MKRNDTTTPSGADTRRTPLRYRISMVMHLLDISHATVYRMIAKGDLELVKLGSRTSRITSASVQRIISGRTGQG
ncbi:helix-turn-helix transcriptional regulator [Massilia niabensis]|uniref:Helix-turn-helix transcriptional regulator n=1 Tax=Massilia niabensis TaxID=544910 RepID=A0ABW0L424_9BURK